MLEKPKVLIVEGRFYENITDMLCMGAIAVLDEAGMDYERIAVPGAFEIPQAIQFAVQSMKNKSSLNFGSCPVPIKASSETKCGVLTSSYACSFI